SQALRGTYVNHVLQLSDTRLSISTQTSGLFIYDVETNTIERITAQDGLESNSCLRTFQDYTGNLWVGMQSGIAIVYINSPMRYINQEIGLNGSGYEAFESENGTYYSTSNGIYFLPQNREQCIFLRGTEGPAYGIQEIGGNIYACHHTGLFQLLSDQARRIATTDGLWDVKQLNSNPEYAIGGTYSGLYLFRIDDNQYLQPIQQIEGFNETSRFFEEDNHGSIWVSQYYRGLYRLILSEDFKSVIPEKITTDDGTPIDQQIILSSIDNELYIATSEGVFQYDQTKNTIVEDDIFSKLIGRQSVYLFEQDKQKNVHLITENQVGFFKKISSRNYVFVPSSLYQLRYYLNNDLLNISSNTERGVLFSSNEGFIHYNPNLENQLSSERPIAISRISSVTQDSILYLLNPFEKKPDHDLNLVIGPYDKTIQIDVESYQYNNVTNPKFRYFLKGLDDDYGEWTSASMKEYTNLKEGKYEFNAQARNHLGEIFSTQILHIQVDPPIHLSTAFKLLYILLGCLLLLLLFRGQKRKYSKETLKIEEAKEHQLAEEQQKLVELQQQKEKEMLALTEEKMKSELRHVNNLLAASTMNLVVKNEFIENIKEELKEVNKKDKNVQTSQALKKIVKEIDTSLRLQEDWEQFEYHFDQVHGDFLSRLRDQFHDLSPNEQKLSALLRLNLNTKEISNLMSISVRGVEVARYRLRQKLELEKGQNLSKFILEY
ncbi:MAG: hypothetical protein KJP00_11620, partial [Bacteroidia bacterium]|nr:hypothetical protein [Bacteroidia bacterium]